MRCNMNINEKLELLYSNLHKFSHFHENTIPLCAAENVLSDFCKIPLNGDMQERYIMGNYLSYKVDDNFIGSQFLLPVYEMIQNQCEVLFHSKYSDARTLSGMNCLTTLLMALTSLGDKIAILPPEWGGHASFQPVCERLGLIVYHLPYDESVFDIDYESANKLLNDENIPFVLLAPSDILFPLSIEKLDLDGKELLYDISQVMGLIAGRAMTSPLTSIENVVMFGGTHKTLPGPTSGLILTSNDKIHKRLDTSINPKYMRNTQMHQVASLLFALLEMEEYGVEYSRSIITSANDLGYALEKQGFSVGKVNGRYSETHQVFIFCDDEKEMEKINKNAIFYGVTLNKKQKPLFKNNGIRLGVQEIARYGWNNDSLDSISLILKELIKECPDGSVVNSLKNLLPSKKIQFTFPDEQIDWFLDRLRKE